MNFALIFSTCVVNYLFLFAVGVNFCIFCAPFAPILLRCSKKMDERPEHTMRYLAVSTAIVGFVLLLVYKSVWLMVDMNLAQPIYHNCVSMLMEVFG